MAIRLNKYISDSGMCSRREADRYIEQGQVLVNGKRAKVGDQVSSQDRVMVSGNLVEPREEEPIYVAYNKPPGVVTTTTAGVRNSILGAIRYHGRLVPVGQLDKEAQGLVLLSNNGEFVNRVLRSGQLENEYVVMLDKPITEPLLAGLMTGGGQPSAAKQHIRVQKDTPYICRITLRHDTVRQIQRWCEQYGYKVVQMERIRVMNISLKGIGLGEWRELRASEVRELLGLLAQPAPPSEPKPAPRRLAPLKGPRPEDEWLELPAEPKPRRAAPRSAGAGSPPAGPRRTSAARTPGKTAPQPGRAGASAKRSVSGPAKSKPTSRTSRSGPKPGKRS